MLMRNQSKRRRSLPLLPHNHAYVRFVNMKKRRAVSRLTVHAAFSQKEILLSGIPLIHYSSSPMGVSPYVFSSYITYNIPSNSSVKRSLDNHKIPKSCSFGLVQTMGFLLTEYCLIALYLTRCPDGQPLKC